MDALLTITRTIDWTAANLIVILMLAAVGYIDYRLWIHFKKMQRRLMELENQRK